MNRFQQAASPEIDKVASNIRTQIINLHTVLETIERTHYYGDSFTIEALKEAENELRRLRKFIQN